MALRSVDTPLATPVEITRLIQEGSLPQDRVFDQYLPPDLRAVSSRHWTPLPVVTRASQWLHAFGVSTVVDIGSGAGKFCVAGALAGACRFLGLERRPRLVAAARRLACAFRVQDRVRFCEITLGESEFPTADAYYLFNPFAENVFGVDERIDHDVDLGTARYHHDIAITRRLLGGAPAGTFVLTYHGFGGRLPAAYESVCVDRSLPGVLQMWRKESKRQVGAFG